ncbi:polysaccharide deacetylase family protein [Metapseudomonas otitidis]|uniref:polysaccharide deacetylase family protein n=1 Tax=Metapseudomonas otitidis TaxID=319939 RepID=UPI0013F65437|nr:polysaccharide deacetylase family protein [Pseudomonas otitidis]
MFRPLVFGAALLGATFAQAAGPSRIALIDRSTWPAALDSPAAFDDASRGEILVFAQTLLQSEGLDAAAWQQRLGLKAVDLDGIATVRKRFWARLAENYRLASQGCNATRPFCEPAADEAALRERARRFEVAPDSPFFAWSEASRGFHLRYLDEQMRLAALFPRISSEIGLFSERERNGDELKDRQFLLTFDDGPTPRDGLSERLTTWLREQHMSATFYVLGQGFQTRLGKTSPEAMRQLYAGQCVGLHGWEHKSHSSWAQWQDSVVRVRDLVARTLPDNTVPLFRPPYGQRRADSGAFFAAQGLTVALWNIDSQDWNARISGDEAAQRVLNLMLLWRRGVVLFHDIHPKALAALPWLKDRTALAGVDWMPCNTYR